METCPVECLLNILSSLIRPDGSNLRARTLTLRSYATRATAGGIRQGARARWRVAAAANLDRRLGRRAWAGNLPPARVARTRSHCALASGRHVKPFLTSPEASR